MADSARSSGGEGSRLGSDGVVSIGWIFIGWVVVGWVVIGWIVSIGWVFVVLIVSIDWVGISWIGDDMEDKVELDSMEVSGFVGISPVVSDGGVGSLSWSCVDIGSGCCCSTDFGVGLE